MSDLKKEKLSYFDIFRKWTESTTIHGFPNIFQTKSITIRIMWIICFLASNAFCCYIISTNIMNYFKYEVVTAIKNIQKDSLPFPAVTVCNANPFVTKEGLKYVSSFLQQNNFTNFPDLELNIFGEIDYPRIFFNYNFIRYMTSTLSKAIEAEMKKMFSFSFKEMFISCLFNLEPCNENNWEWHYDYFYGNCYRFNTGKNFKGEKINISFINNAGKYNGLMLELFAGMPNNSKSLSLTNGVDIFIDDNNFKPNPQRGFGVATGFSTNMAIEKIKTKLMPQPYSECVENLESIDSFDSEYYNIVFRSNLIYRQENCFDAYYSSEIFKNCKCDDMGNNFVYENNNTCDTWKDQSCVLESIQKISATNFRSRIKQYCPLECESIRFKITKSENNYPSESYGNDLLKIDKIKSLFANRSDVSNDELRKNILAVNVYYEYLEKQ